MFNKEGVANSLSLGSAKYSKPFSRLLGLVNLPAQRHTSLFEGVCILPKTSAFIPRLARVRSAIVQTLIWKLIRNANQSANGDQQLATVLVQKWLTKALGARLGNYFFRMAFPETPSPVNLSSRDGMPHYPYYPLADGSFNLSRSRGPSAFISLFTREDEI